MTVPTTAAPTTNRGWLPSGVRAIRVLLLVLVLAVWEAVASFGGGLRSYVPHVWDLAAALGRVLGEEEFASHVQATLIALGSGVAIGGVAGVLVGLAITSVRSVRFVLEPVVLYLGAIPKIVLYPLFIYTLSVGMASKVGMASLSVFFPVAVSTVGSAWLIRPVWLRAATVLDAGRWQAVRHVALPAMLPSILTGVQLGVAAGIVGTVAAESKVGKEGIGHMVIDYYSRLELPEMYVLVLLVFVCASVLAIGMNRVLKGLRKAEERQSNQPLLL